MNNYDRNNINSTEKILYRAVVRDSTCKLMYRLLFISLCMSF